jgi:hypothetical protein
MLNPKELYGYVYKKLGGITPIPADCGKLCKKACCAGGDDAGMYLFPREKELYNRQSNVSNRRWYKIINLSHKKAVFFTCKGECRRIGRPLSCRIFPLTPYITKTGDFSVIIDPRAKSVCPLAKSGTFEYLDPKFVEKVTETMTFLLKFQSVREYFHFVSREIDELCGISDKFNS